MYGGILLQVVILIVGFVLLIKGSDFFVDGSSNVASLLKIPTIIVGLTIVAFGTSAPEAAVSITSSITGSNALAVSNVIGSNLFNMLLIIGLCAMLKELKMDKPTLETDLPFLVVATIICSVLMLIGFKFSRIDGIIALAILIIYIYFIIRGIKKGKDDQSVSEVKMGLPRSVLYILGGLAGIVIGANFVVDSASNIAMAFGMSETLVGLTIVAMGTSLPELATSITAIRKNEEGLVIGNVLGSNLFNLLFVLGLSSAISPITINHGMYVDILLLVGVTILFYIFGKTQDKFDRKEGIILLILFIAYMAFAVMRN